MSHLIEATVDDLKHGRETWRVHLIILIPTVMAALGLALSRVQ